MSIPVPIGQFVPGESMVHRLDARSKLVATAAFTLGLFGITHWLGLLVWGLIVCGAIAVSGVPPRLAARGLRPIAWLLLFTVAINGLRWGDAGAASHLGPLWIHLGGVARGLFFATRIMLLILGTSLVTLTTSPVELTDALSTLMRPLARIRVPVDDVAMMLSIALRFVPTTAEEADRVVVAQSARGARFDDGGLLKRTKAWIPVLVPLFVRLFKRADRLAVAMETRCYTGKGRTRLRVSVMRSVDWATVAGSVAVAVLLAAVL